MLKFEEIVDNLKHLLINMNTSLSKIEDTETNWLKNQSTRKI